MKRHISVQVLEILENLFFSCHSFLLSGITCGHQYVKLILESDKAAGVVTVFICT